MSWGVDWGCVYWFLDGTLVGLTAPLAIAVLRTRRSRSAKSRALIVRMFVLAQASTRGELDTPTGRVRNLGPIISLLMSGMTIDVFLFCAQLVGAIVQQGALGEQQPDPVRWAWMQEQLEAILAEEEREENQR